MCGGYFSCEDANPPMLLDVLPPLVLVRASDPRGQVLARLSELLVSEVATHGAGRSPFLSDLAQIVFIHMLRAHAGQTAQPTG